MRDIVPGPVQAEDADAAGASDCQNAERWLAAIVKSSDDAILGKSLTGIITSWNAGATRIFGYEPQEALGRHISFLAWPGEEERIETFIERVGRGERIDHFEVARRHKSGRKIIVSLSLSPIRDASGTVIGIAKIARDMTERKAVEARLAANELSLRAFADRRFRELIEHAPDAILQVDSTGAIVIANYTAETMFGYSRDEFIGNGVDMLVPDAIRSAHAGHRAAFAAAGKSRPMGQGLNLFARRKDGSQFPVEISLSPVHSDNGVNITAVIRDITERKQIEHRVRAL